MVKKSSYVQSGLLINGVIMLGRPRNVSSFSLLDWQQAKRNKKNKTNLKVNT